MAKEELKREEKVKRSLRYSIIDGSFYSSMVGFGESFFSAFAVFLKATNFQLGLLGSLPLALGSLIQLFSNRLIKRFNSRKAIVCLFAMLQGFMYIPVALTFFLGDLNVFYLVLFICLYYIFGMILTPAWSSWMGDLVDEHKRGDYFGRRNRITGIITFTTFVIGGFVLQTFVDGPDQQYKGFLLIFAIALASRIISFIYLMKKYDPPFRITHQADFSFVDFIMKARFTNYGHFVIFLALMNFAVYIATPFFSAFMLNDLKMDYITFTIVTATAIIVKYVTMPAWGAASDKFGTKKVLALSSFLMPAVPLLWMLSTDTSYLLLVQVYSGFVWAGFEITSFNFIFDSTSHEKRATCVAYYNVINGAAIFVGAMLGAVLIRYDHTFWSKFYIVFLVSFAIRYIISFIFVPKLKEVRQVQNIDYKDLFMHILSSTPNMGLIHYIITFRQKK